MADISNIIKKFSIQKKLMADNKLSASFSYPSFVEININDYIDIAGERYFVLRPPTVKKGATQYEYQLTLEGHIYRLLRKIYLLDGKKRFTINGNLEYFIDLLITNINSTQSGWVKGTFPITQNKTLTFTGVDCRSVLNTLATEFDVEFDVVGQTINFATKISNPTGHVFEYGAGKGLYELSRGNVDNRETVTRVYGFGGSRNLPKNYRLGANELVFESKYLEDTSKVAEIIEGEYTNEDIYPRFEGQLSYVSTDFLTVRCPSMDFNLLNQLNEGQEAKVVFKAGDLEGKEFRILSNSYNDSTKEFKIIAEIDEFGNTFPNAVFKPVIGDVITFIDIHMPQSYVDNAEAELQAATQEYLNENSSVRVSYRLELDNRFLTKYGILPAPGDVVRVVDKYDYLATDFDGNIFTDFDDSEFLISNVLVDQLIRISEINYTYENGVMTIASALISDYISISASQRLITQTLDSKINIENNKTQSVERARENALANRQLKDLVFDPDGYFDNNNIKPRSIETLLLSVGAVSSNFLLRGVTISANYLGDENHFKASAGILEHLEIARSDSGKQWAMTELNQTGLNPSEFYYLYAKCSKTSNAGVWELSTSQITADQPNDYYFSVGILYDVQNGFRHSTFTYGTTLINGGEITTGVIKSIDGSNYFNLNTGQINFGNSSSYIHFNPTVGVWDFKNVTIKTSNDNTKILGSSLQYRGPWNATYQYLNNEYLQDVAKVGSAFYAYIGANNQTAPIPPNATYWEVVNSFSNIATELLLAEQAVIENAIVRTLKTAESGRRVEVNIGKTNKISVYDVDNDESILIDDNLSVGTTNLTSGIRLQKGNGFAQITPEGVSAVKAGTYIANEEADLVNASLLGLGQALNQNTGIIAGLYARATNQGGSAPIYAAYLDGDTKTDGLVLSPHIYNVSSDFQLLNSYTVHVIQASVEDVHIFLPALNVVPDGKVVIVTTINFRNAQIYASASAPINDRNGAIQTTGRWASNSFQSAGDTMTFIKINDRWISLGVINW